MVTWLSIAVLGMWCAPQEPFQVSADLQQEINRAIDRGVDALLHQQELDGSWRANQPAYRTGMTSLAVYTLRRSGLALDHPAVDRAYRYLQVHPPQHTYSVACAVLAESARGEAIDEDRLQELADQLLDWQLSEGFGYPSGPPDLSNTQYGALALHVAAEHGADIPDKAWRRLGEAGLRYQEEIENRRSVTGSASPIGFGYRPADATSTGSMTAAGITVLEIARRHVKGRSAQFLAARDQGLAWLGENFMVDANPSPSQSPTGVPGRLHYYLYGLERVAGLVGLDLIGDRAWYAEGARFLVDHQEGSGRWANGQPQTCFALLFLSRATSGGLAATPGGDAAAGGTSAYVYGGDDPSRDLSIRASGREKITVWLSSIGDRVSERDTWIGEDGPRIGAARYRLEKMASAQPRVEVIEIPVGDPGQPLAGRRFAWNGTFDSPGSWRVQLELDSVPPQGRIGDRDSWVRLHSPVLTIPLAPCWVEHLDAYAGAVNPLVGQVKRVQASSEHSTSWTPQQAFDGFQATGWISADGDPTPRLAVEFDDPVKADTLVLSHAFNLAQFNPRHHPRVVRFRYRINGGRRWTEAAMIPSDWHKTEIDLGKTLKVRTLEIEVLESSPGQTQITGTGFNEVELQRRG